MTVCLGNPFLKPVPAARGEKTTVWKRYGKGTLDAEGWGGA